MSITNRFKVTISPLRLRSASSVQIPYSTNRFKSLLPSVKVTPLKRHTASSINLHGASNNNTFRNRLNIRLSPMKSPIQCTRRFSSAMPRVASAANIFIVKVLLFQMSIIDNFLSSMILT